MICTECKRKTPPCHRTSQLRDLGWFVWARGAPVKFSGVVLCPRCRGKQEASDAYGARYPTADLERLASGGEAWPS
jgi:hypothetical protein